jgi:hypothetical protein
MVFANNVTRFGRDNLLIASGVRPSPQLLSCMVLGRCLFPSRLPKSLTQQQMGWILLTLGGSDARIPPGVQP